MASVVVFLLRLLAIYFIFIVIRGIYRRYKFVKSILNGQNDQGQKHADYSKEASGSKTFEADYKVVDDDK